MEDVDGSKGTGKELGTEEGEVVMDAIDFGFHMKMINRTHLHTADGNAEGGILHALEYLDGGGGEVGKPDRVKREEMKDL